MNAFGLCVSPRFRQVADDIPALKPAFVRSILYDVVDDLDWLLSLNLPIMLTLNNEADMCAGWAGWENMLRYVAARSRGQIMGVSCGNELSNFWARNPSDVPPEFCADLIRKAAPILRPAGIKVYTDALAGPRWYDYLQRLLQLAGDQIDMIDSHAGYGRSPDGWGRPGWMFGTQRDMIAQIRRITGKPIVMSEIGVKVSDAGGEEQQAAFLTATATMLRDLDVTAAWFCWTDQIGGPDERGPNGFGLQREDGSARPAWAAFKAVNAAPVPVPVPTPVPPPDPPAPPTPPEPALSALDAAYAALWNAVDESIVLNPDSAFYKAWRANHRDWGSPVSGEIPDADGTVLQTFANAGPMRWTGGDTIMEAA